MKYADEIYEEEIVSLISDIHYSNASFSSKVALIRKNTEYIVRRLLHYDSGKKLTLGHPNTQKLLDEKGCVERLFVDSIEALNVMGSDRTHTQIVPVAKEDEYRIALDNFFNLYAYLFVDYFKKYPFGSNNDVLTAFSILPVRIRYFALLCLYELYPNNMAIIDKLILATAKFKGLDACLDWIEDNKSRLEVLSKEISPDDNKELTRKYGVTVAKMMNEMASRNMYNICIEKAKLISLNYKPLYTNFEQALQFYKAYGTIPGSSIEVKEFNDLMHYVYLGRKEAPNS